MGFSQPKIGNFTIPIGEIMHDNFARQKTLLESADKFIEKLQSVESGENPAAAGAGTGAAENDDGKINVAINEEDEAGVE